MVRFARFSGVAVVVSMCFLTGCMGPGLPKRRTDATRAVASLQDGRFDAAVSNADKTLSEDDRNPHARLVRGIVTYRKTMHQLWLDGRTVIIGGLGAGGFNARYLRSSMVQAETDLARVESDLAEVWKYDDVSLDLCPACWEIDWNGNGRIDRRDRLLFQVEQDSSGERIPKGDPRRKPTFRFDHGDIAWARAFVSFQRAALDIVLAYDLSEINRAIVAMEGNGHPKIVIRLAHPERIETAKKLLLEALNHSDEARRAYLEETDDEREWVPSPRQRNHPLPLPIDNTLYQTWEGAVSDLRMLVRGEEGLSVCEVAQLGDHVWENPPSGFVDIGRMLSEPKDIVIDIEKLERLDRTNDVGGMLRAILGEYYVPNMKRSALPKRLKRMKSEVDRGEESLERKLRYLIWIN